jgi:hypothetical protein
MNAAKAAAALHFIQSAIAAPYGLTIIVGWPGVGGKGHGNVAVACGDGSEVPGAVVGPMASITKKYTVLQVPPVQVKLKLDCPET